ncbi:hypothetical protein [Streptomyces sp. NPDC058157]|uniref:hypothetical protein n=1 Tax=Streptomyces sp. NPDC058157 TaxID=3346360 RepID=UPI0036E2130D
MIKNSFRGFAATALAFTALSLSLPAAEAHAVAAANIVIIDGYTKTVKESAGTPVECPEYQVMLGRSHSGDENGNTTYYCGFILVNNEIVNVEGSTWTGSQRESDSLFTAPSDQAMVGRVHSGDENGQTRHANAAMTWEGRTVELTSYRWTEGMKESSSYSKAGPGEIMVGRQHKGDENGTTWYRYAKVTLG